MIAVGYSPSVRLFEAAACGVPIISDNWDGLDTLFAPGKEILIAKSTDEVLHILREMPAEKRKTIAAAARRCVLQNHTAHHRALQLEDYYQQAAEGKREARRAGKPASVATGRKEKRQPGRLLQA
jgi:spore maturation protein CgeB